MNILNRVGNQNNINQNTQKIDSNHKRNLINGESGIMQKIVMSHSQSGLTIKQRLIILDTVTSLITSVQIEQNNNESKIVETIMMNNLKQSDLLELVNNYSTIPNSLDDNITNVLIKLLPSIMLEVQQICTHR